MFTEWLEARGGSFTALLTNFGIIKLLKIESKIVLRKPR